MGMNQQTYTDEYLREILGNTHTIALVGASDKSHRASNGVMRFLQKAGYRVIPVNPRLVGTELFDEPVYECVTDIPDTVDMVDVFRNSDALEQIVDRAIEKQVKYVWAQLGVYNEAATEKAEAAGIKVVMNRCPKIELSRLRQG